MNVNGSPGYPTAGGANAPVGAPSGTSAAGTYAIASAGLDLLGGLFGYFAGEQLQEAAESRGRMIRMEADAEATRYAEQARHFKASQKVAFLKNGVTLTGSPLDVLDHDMLTAQQNIDAIRARGAAGQLDAEGQGAAAGSAGRSALIAGITSGSKTLIKSAYLSDKSDLTGAYNRRNQSGYVSP